MSLLDLILQEEFSEDSDEYKEVLARASENVAEKDKPAVDKTLKMLLTANKPINSVLGIDEKQEAKLYVDACQMYEGGKYGDAETLFMCLYGMYPTKQKYIFGLAASVHRQERYDEALGYYMMALGPGYENPKPWYHAADCYRHLNQPEKAYEALDSALLYSVTEDQYQELVPMIISEMETLEKELGIEVEEPTEEEG